MPASHSGSEQARRLADRVREAILSDGAPFDNAEGRAIVHVLLDADPPRIKVTATTPLRCGHRHASGTGARRLDDDIRRLADAVHAKLLADKLLIDHATRLEIEIQLRDPKFEIGFSFKT
jgi:hypothetical protein